MTAQRPLHAFDVIPGEPQPSLLALFFRRVLRMPWRKPAVPEVHFSASGTGRTGLLDVPAGWTVSPSGSLISPYPVAGGRHASSARVACNSAQDRTIPRKRTADRPPWSTAQFPVYNEAPQLIVEPEMARRWIA